MKKLVQHPLLVAVLVFAFSLGAALWMVESESRRIIAEQRHQAFIHLSTLRASLEGTINANLGILRGLRAEVAINPELTQTYFDKIAPELLSDDLQIRHIALAPDLVIRQIYPLEGNESALGLDLRTVPEQIGAVQKAIQHNAIILAGPLDLVQGGRALIARMPVFIGPQRDQFWGMLAAVIDYQALLQAAGVNQQHWPMSLAIRGQDASGANGPVFFGRKETFAEDAVRLKVSLPYGNWQIAARPPAGWQVPEEQLDMMWGRSGLLSLLLALAGYLLALAYRDKAQAVETAVYRAHYDGLTGLMNRHYFTHHLENAIKEAKREGAPFALMFTDLDRFKQVNDNYGHAVGDQLLMQFAQRLQEPLRHCDEAARLAGDEFVVLVKPATNILQLEQLAEQLLQRLNDVYCIDQRILSITSSIGIARYPTDGENAEQLLKNSDHAMYAAKSAGRNQVFFFNHAMRQEVEHYLQMHNEILQGLRQAQFEVYYQPILQLANHRISKCEALVRWRHPERGLVSPGEFISVAEQTGAIQALGNYVLEQVCQDIHSFRRAGLTLKVAVNRSVNEFHARDASDHWKALLASHQVRGDEIVFEITESLLMERNEHQLAVIDNLNGAGVQFSIDDFGTGYSALNYLRSYPVEFLKIDRDFIKDLLHDEQDRTLVEVIIRMGKTLGIQVVAEGVESQEQIDLLREQECDYIQGFFISKPMPRNEFIAFCQTWTQETAAISSSRPS